MPINFVFRNLTGFYRGSTINAINDYIKISNMFLEIAKDLSSIDGRLKALEATAITIITNDNFTTNSISGTVIQRNTLPGTAIENNSITGAQIITNSINGLTDANLSSNASINPSKINLSALSHTQIKDIGVNTHPQIDAFISTVPGQISTLSTNISNTNSTVGILNSNLATLNSFVSPGHLLTTSQNVTGAINELDNDVVTLGAAIGASGYAVTTPGSTVLNSVPVFGSTNGRTLIDTLATIDSSGGFVTPGNLISTAGNLAGRALNLNSPTVNYITSVASPIYIEPGLDLDLKPGVNFSAVAPCTSAIAGNTVGLYSTAGIPGTPLGSGLVPINTTSEIIMNSGNINITSLGSMTLAPGIGMPVTVVGGGELDAMQLGSFTNPVLSGWIQNLNVTQITGPNYSYLDMTNPLGGINIQGSSIGITGPGGILIGMPGYVPGIGTIEISGRAIETLSTDGPTILNNTSNGNNSMFEQDGNGNTDINDTTLALGGAVSIDATVGNSSISVENSSITILSSGILELGGGLQCKTLALGDHPAGGSIGSAATTVNLYSAFNIQQTTPGQILSLPTPFGNTTAGNLVYIVNGGSTPVEILSLSVPVGAGITAMYFPLIGVWACVGKGF